MTLTQTAARAALIEELALMVARHRMDIPADFEGMAESNAAPAMRIRNSCAKLEASPASDARKSSAPQSRLSLGCRAGERPRWYFDKVRARNRATGSGIRAPLA